MTNSQNTHRAGANNQPPAPARAPFPPRRACLFPFNIAVDQIKLLC